MAEEPASVRLLREALEEVLPTSQAAAVLFDGLAAWGHRVPVSADELSAAVRGPVREALLRRLPPGDADGVIDKVIAALATAEAPTDVHAALGEPEIEIDVDVTFDDEATTGKIPSDWPEERSTLDVGRRVRPGAPVPVLVLADTGAFAARLRLALGAERVAPATQRELNGAAGLLGSAAVIVVDATDIPPLEPDEIGRVLSDLPRDCIASVWGTDLPFGRRVVDAVAAAGGRIIGVAQTDGIEPLADLVRSRL